MADKLKVQSKRELRRRRHVRTRISGTTERPRLTVCKSNKNTVAQIIDDLKGATIAYSTTATIAGAAKMKKTDAAKELGKAIAAAAKEKGITTVVFDRNRYIYHGRVRAVAEGAREGGLEF